MPGILRSLMDLVATAPPAHGQAVTGGIVTLATLGGVGLAVTQHLAWIIPLLISGGLAVYGAWLNGRFKTWQLKVDAEVYKAEARRKIRETGETVIPQGLEPGHVEDIDDMGSGSHPRLK